ncbi:MAG: poly-beta-1,6-N-acetyl-D-glucosamine N-deacetylase PgaB [Pseudomonadales bacterium]|nr:poly-beta-1,6-N-acetyl-D-glucosamine N-deacetylase PgaB [Pseudomonadales bacterium]
MSYFSAVLMFLFGSFAFAISAQASQPGFNFSTQEYDYIALCFHDVRDDVVGDLDNDPGAVNTNHLALYFEWLRTEGYNPISLKDIELARSGEKDLPEKAILLTFDDGYISFYSKIYPLLKLYQYPAVFALVTSWLEKGPQDKVPYGKELRSRSDFLTWDQVKEMHASGLVEIASHSHNLHRGVLANPQGNIQAAAVTRQLNGNGEYEDDVKYRKRIYQDIKKSADILEARAGVRPKAIVWPYGRFSGETYELAKKAGLEHSLILDDGLNELSDGPHIKRILISDNPDLNQFKSLLDQINYQLPERVVHVDLDYVFDPDPEQQNRNLSALIDRIYKLNISTVYLQAFADPDGDGNADALYFQNRHLPVREDLFNRVSWQLQTRAKVKVFAWMPVSAFWIGEEFYRDHGVYALENGTPKLSQAPYKRLSIFSKKAQTIIFDVFEDLAKHTQFNGILFHDDAYLSDFEDVRPEALAYYRQKGMKFDSPAELRKNAETISQWGRVKTRAIVDFTHLITQRVERFRPLVKTARNIYAQPIINPMSEDWFAQNLVEFTKAYDTTAIMAMPLMEGASDSIEWLRSLVKKVQAAGVATDKVLFELQSVDWRKNGSPIEPTLLVEKMKLLQEMGWYNYGYYPDDFIQNRPKLSAIFPVMSLSDYPHERK